MKRTITLLLVLCLALSLLAGCGSQPAATPTETTAATEPATEATAPLLTGKEALQGKKIIFLGNSYTFWGQAVIHKGYEVLSQNQRSNDPGYFYQLCKQNGVDVEVTNWTFGAHDITDITGESCNAQRDCQDQRHPYFLTDPYFDYVAIQCYSEKEYLGNLQKHLQTTMDFFREANPNVRFLLLVPHQAYEKSYRWVSDLEDLDDSVLICNWGALAHDLSQGNVQVPGGTLEYSRSTFVVAKDDHHQTLLAGYITSLMVYCAITGESAVGQPYAFCDDSSIHEKFDLDLFLENNFPDGATSNFAEVFRSEADMQGVQQLTDQYIAKFNQ